VRRALAISVLTALAAAAPASAQLAQKPLDVVRVEAAVVELSKAKGAADGQVASNEHAAASALSACRTKGRGWARVRKVRDRAQRNAYARGAKALWKSLSTVAKEGAWVDAYTPALERFLRRFDTPLTDPVLQAGIDAQRHRLAFNQAANSFGTCAVFNAELRKVREFKIGGSHGVAGDYYAGKIYNDFVRYASRRQAKAVRAHWGSRYQAALDAAAGRLAMLGGNEGYAHYFPFAFKG
jgi:hypothetical protein